MEQEGYVVEVAEGYDEAVTRARIALKSEGFSIISEMHVGGMLGPEAGDERQYLIMGAWSGPVARRDVDSDLEVAVHLPCNIVVQEQAATAIVAVLDPAEDLEPGEQESETAEEARAAIARMLGRIAD